MPTFLTSRLIVDHLTFKVQRDRFWRREAKKMALEIKGLKGKALKAGAMFDRLNKGYDKLIETGEAHAADVESLPAQIDGMQDDLQFMVQTLGNSISGQSGQQQQRGEQQTVSSQEVGQVDQQTFQGK